MKFLLVALACLFQSFAFSKSDLISVEQKSVIHSYQLQAEFIEQFPFSDYTVYALPDQRSFYVDYVNDYIKGNISKGIAWEAYIDDYIEKYGRPQSILIDIGAHIGSSGKLLC